MLSKNSSVSRWNASRRLSSKSGNRLTTGSLVFSDADVQPLAGEVRDQRLRLRIREHAPDLLLEHRRLA